MSATTTINQPGVDDQPGVDASNFSATLVETPGLEHTLTVTGEATGDYRVQQVILARARHQESRHTLVLEVQATLGPVENPHPELIRIIPLQYSEKPAAHRYNHILVMNGSQHFKVTVEDVL